jgi:hypothetical protein
VGTIPLALGTKYAFMRPSRYPVQCHRNTLYIPAALYPRVGVLEGDPAVGPLHIYRLQDAPGKPEHLEAFEIVGVWI